jgi:anti-sigma regulatory factor (Ser/Thr protein kinase)
MPSNSLRQSLCATPDAVPLARRMVCDFVAENCPDAPQIADPVALTVSEAVGNAVRHAYPDGMTGPVELQADLEAPDLVITILDEGVGMGGQSSDPGLGLGMTIMRSMARLRIEPRPQGGTLAVLRFRCGADAAQRRQAS